MSSISNIFFAVSTVAEGYISSQGGICVNIWNIRRILTLSIFKGANANDSRD
jgi:hypothetical protein